MGAGASKEPIYESALAAAFRDTGKRRFSLKNSNPLRVAKCKQPDLVLNQIGLRYDSARNETPPSAMEEDTFKVPEAPWNT